jgi:acetyl esterase/lipase
MTPNLKLRGLKSLFGSFSSEKEESSFFEKKEAKKLLFLALFGVSACSPAQLLNATIPLNHIDVTHDVAYGPEPRQKLDIYAPAGAHDLPTIVFFYGGAWNSGSKSIYPFVAATLARKGTIVVVPDYRLYPQVRFPTFLEDCARSVAWTQAHLTALGGDPHKLFLMGHSAGAYNAVMLGLDPRYLKAQGASRDAIAGIIGLAGPYDFLPITGADIKPIFATVNDGPASQPVTYVDGHAPPMLLLTGSADTTVFPRNTVSLAAKIRARGGQAETEIFPGVTHIGLVLAIAPVFQGNASVLPDTMAFIHTHATGTASIAATQPHKMDTPAAGHPGDSGAPPTP